MCVVFLDIDGVLNNRLHLLGLVGLCRSDFRLMIDPEKVELLNMILRATGAVIVVSSSWRHGRSLDELRMILADRGLRGDVIDVTPDASVLKGPAPHGGWMRGHEIEAWLDAHPTHSEFVVLDDDDDMAGVQDHLIQTSFDDGLTLEHVEQAIKVLGGRCG